MVAVAGVVAVAGPFGLAGLDDGPQPFGVEGLCEDDLYLGGGLLGGDEGGEPFAGDDVEDGVGDPAGSGEVGYVIDPDLVALPFDPVRQGPRRCRRALRARAGRTSPWAARTRYSVDGDTQTRFS